MVCELIKMGVPHFINWLVSRYPLIARRMNDASRPKIDCFFVDFNCIIHTSMRTNKTINQNNSEDEIIKEVFRYLDILVQIVCPTSLLFISVDGPAPLAKCRQQRSRRFIREINPDPTSTFESNAISVGTEFMENLHQKLSDFLKERVKNDINWRKPTVIYSSYRTPGEGEHKFFDFIRSQKKLSFWNENASCCVYSPDADLVFVCLQSCIKNFCILRESNAIFPEIKTKYSVNDSGIRYFANDFVLISINLIREYMTLDFETDDPRIFDDFTAISYLIGNDFIPHFPDVKIEKGEFSIIVDIYKTQFLKEGKFLINGESFNSDNLSEFIRESVLQIASVKKKANSLEDFLQAAENKIHSQMPEEYEKDPEELKKSLSHSIIDSFYWVFQYYKNGVPSWTWFYPYYYAPSLIIVAKYIKDYKPDFEVGCPPTPFVQLLTIMPPQSRDLLPKALQPLMESDSPIGYLYPSEFKVVGGKAEGTAIVPFVDIEKVRKAFLTVAINLTEDEKSRNKIIPPYIVKEDELAFVDETRKVIDFHLFNNEANLPCVPSLFFYDIKPKVVNFPVYNGPQSLDLLFSIPVSPNNAPTVVNKTILVGWPYFIPAIVKNIVYVNNHTKGSTEKTINEYKKVYGLDISKTQCFVNAQVLQFVDNHELNIDWSKESMLFPFQQTAPISSTNTILRFKPKEGRKAKIDDLAVIIKGQNKGKLCKIKSMKKDYFELQQIVHQKRIYDMNLILEDDDQCWIPISKVAAYFSLNLKILESVLTDLHTEKYKTNFAFVVIKDNKGVQGFCTKRKNEICVTQNVVSLLQAYFEKADPLLLALKTYNETENTLESILDEYIDTYEEVKIEKIRKWVKENSPSRYFPYVKLYKHFPANETIKTIESIMIEEYQDDTLGSIIQEKESNLVWKGKYVPPFIERIDFGSNVITINPSGIVPFGTYGVVIGVSFNGQLAHIIADNEFEYGNQMQGCLKTNRGFALPTRDLCVFE